MNGTRPLLVSTDADLIDDVLRLAAANGVEVHLATETDAARSRWQLAPLVLVGADAAAALAGAGMGRRRDVVLVSRAPSPDDWQWAVAIGAEHVVSIPDGERWLIDRLADCGEGAPRDGSVVAVIAGSGGAGASTLAATLALGAAARSQRVLLVDGDCLGGGLDVLMGIEEAPGVRWSDLLEARGRLGAAALDQALPHVSGVTVLSWGRAGPTALPVDVVAAVLDAGVRGYDLVIADVARHLDAAGELLLSRADAPGVPQPRSRLRRVGTPVGRAPDPLHVGGPRAALGVPWRARGRAAHRTAGRRWCSRRRPRARASPSRWRCATRAGTSPCSTRRAARSATRSRSPTRPRPRVFDAIEYRGAAHTTTHFADVPVYNGLTDGWITEMLADFLTMREHAADPTAPLRYVGPGNAHWDSLLVMGRAHTWARTCVSSRRVSCGPAHTFKALGRTTAAGRGAPSHADRGRGRRAGRRRVRRTRTCGSPWASRRPSGPPALRPHPLPGGRRIPRAVLQIPRRSSCTACLPTTTRTPPWGAPSRPSTWARRRVEVTDDVFELAGQHRAPPGRNRMHTIKAVLVATLS